jgi:hypothetical protein
MKDPALMTHAERMSLLMGTLYHELDPARCATLALEMAELSEKEQADFMSMHQMASQRIGQSVGTASGYGNAVGVGQAIHPAVKSYDGTVKALAEAYRTDPNSGYLKKMHNTRLTYEKHIDRIVREYGPKKIGDLNVDQVCENWLNVGPAIGRALIGMLRIMVTYGGDALNDDACSKVSFQLSNRRLRRSHQIDPLITETEPISEMQSRDLILEAHSMGRPSIALAQALMFECGLNQKDVIGEWVPATEPGDGEVYGDEKWTRGLRWEEIDSDFILRHKSIRGVDTIDLKGKAMVLNELNYLMPPAMQSTHAIREFLPKSGAVVRSERHNNLPWRSSEFRRLWRSFANNVGIPKNVRNKVAADRLGDDDDEEEEISESKGARRARAIRVKTNDIASG